MKASKAILGLVGLSACLASAPADAHHSFAMFDNTKRVDVVGTVSEVQWANPHVWLQVYAPDKTGKMVQWSIESGSTLVLVEQGWTRDSLKPGDKVALEIYPLKDGNAGGSLHSATVDGKTLPSGR